MVHRRIVHVLSYLLAMSIYWTFHLDNTLPTEEELTPKLIFTKEGWNLIRANSFDKDDPRTLFLVLWSLYFIKRIVEVIAIHKYKTRPSLGFFEIFNEFLFYSLFPILIGYEIANKSYEPIGSKNSRDYTTWTISYLLGVVGSIFFPRSTPKTRSYSKL